MARLVPRRRTVQVQVTVTATVLEGSVSQAQFREWLEAAIDRYSRDRHGWVGFGMDGRIMRPEIADIEAVDG